MSAMRRDPKQWEKRRKNYSINETYYEQKNAVIESCWHWRASSQLNSAVINALWAHTHTWPSHCATPVFCCWYFFSFNFVLLCTIFDDKATHTPISNNYTEIIMRKWKRAVFSVRVDILCIGGDTVNNEYVISFETAAFQWVSWTICVIFGFYWRFDGHSAM